MPDYFSPFDAPGLRNPMLVAAFKGWNDAAEAASSSIRYLVREWSAATLTTMDTEDFYVYTETRPRVRLRDGFSREIEWPSLKVYTYVDDTLARDVVLLVGHEPQLRWPTFTRELLALLDRLGVGEVALLGALLADVPHTRPQRLGGSASDEGLRERLRALDVSLSRYEGPTGIVGVLQDACGRAGLPTVSLWGNVPHYITASPNPQVSLALLRQLGALSGLTVNLRTLEGQSRRFRARVDEAIAQSPEASIYVRELEGREGEEDVPGEERSSLPTGPEVVRALEEYLREQRSDGDEGDEDEE
jgi:proteasome assembly chaperone (PAC2) family protein